MKITNNNDLKPNYLMPSIIKHSSLDPYWCQVYAQKRHNADGKVGRQTKSKVRDQVQNLQDQTWNQIAEVFDGVRRQLRDQTSE